MRGRRAACDEIACFDRRCDLAVALVVDARHLLMRVRHDPQLGRRRPRRIRRRAPDVPMPRAAGRRAAWRPAASCPTTPTSCDAGRRARATLCATLAAPPMRHSSRSNSTTGTGASGEMRSTRADEELVEHDVADDEQRAPVRSGRGVACPVRRRSRARDGDRRAAHSGGAAIGGERQGDEDEKQHQELGVAEVVLEQPGGEHARQSPPAPAAAQASVPRLRAAAGTNRTSPASR